MTRQMLGSITYQSLGISARRILDALLHEHMCHGGAENGNLGATYEQLERWGVTAADIRKGLAELEATAFVVRTAQGYFSLGGSVPSRYRLTWIPTGKGASFKPATNDWADVIDDLARTGIGNVTAARKWLRTEVAEHARGNRA